MSDTNVIPLPVAFRPHVVAGETQFPKPTEDQLAALVEAYGDPSPTPRAQFGLRPPMGFFRDVDAALGFEAAREDDLRQQRQAKEIARLARAARAASRGADAVLARSVSETLDALHAVVSERKSVRFQLLAQQIAHLSEVCSLIEAEAQP